MERVYRVHDGLLELMVAVKLSQVVDVVDLRPGLRGSRPPYVERFLRRAWGDIMLEILDRGGTIEEWR